MGFNSGFKGLTNTTLYEPITVRNKSVPAIFCDFGVSETKSCNKRRVGVTWLRGIF